MGLHMQPSWVLSKQLALAPHLAPQDPAPCPDAPPSPTKAGHQPRLLLDPVDTHCMSMNAAGKEKLIKPCDAPTSSRLRLLIGPSRSRLSPSSLLCTFLLLLLLIRRRSLPFCCEALLIGVEPGSAKGPSMLDNAAIPSAFSSGSSSSGSSSSFGACQILSSWQLTFPLSKLWGGRSSLAAILEIWLCPRVPVAAVGYLTACHFTARCSRCARGPALVDVAKSVGGEYPPLAPAASHAVSAAAAPLWLGVLFRPRSASKAVHRLPPSHNRSAHIICVASLMERAASCTTPSLCSQLPSTCLRPRQSVHACSACLLAVSGVLRQAARKT